MKKESAVALSITTSLVAVLTVYFLTINQKETPRITYGDSSPYTLVMNSSNKITTSGEASLEEVSKNVTTALSNQITFSGYNVINNNDGWTTILPSGYVYNPYIYNGDHNQISGIKSISYLGNDSLELHYGYLSNDSSHALYTLDIETLNSGEEFVFNGNYPSYIYLKNIGTNNVNINSLHIHYSCTSFDYPIDNITALMIGNSFADDTVYFSERVADSLGLNLTLFDAYIGGCTINTHYTNIQSGEALYSMRSMNGGNWNYQNNMSLNNIVTSHTWDIVTFQQASAEVGRHDKYSNLENLVNEVKGLVSGSPKYYWHQTWAYDTDYSEWYDYFSYFHNNQEEMFDAIVECYNNEIASLGIFEKTIFNGTAVQNLRTSYMGDTLSRDGKHMSLVHGRYLLASNFVSTVFNVDLKLSNYSYTPEGVNSSFIKVVEEAIDNARNYPGQITNSVYINTEIADYDLSDYTEIDAGLVGCSYWNSQDSTNYNKRNNHVSGTSNKYVSSYRFTKDTLPVGSMVFIKEGLGYRPEAWVDDTPQSFRKDESYNNVLEIDDSFWDGYAYRAFNIFKAGKQTLSGEYVDQQFEDIFDGFHIFVPNSKMEGLHAKVDNTKYDDDKSLFENNGVDIDNYERIHLDPITGFYNSQSYYYLMTSYTDDNGKKFVCTKPFYTYKNDLKAGTVIIIDSGYQYRSDCWEDHATHSPRPGNVTTNFTILDSSFMSDFRRRTFNVSSTNSIYVGQNSIEFMNHLRIYIPID